jgi:PAS domain S-box-containing protein
MRWTIERKIHWGLGIAVAVLCSLAMIAYALIVSFVNTSNWVLHSHVVIETTSGVRTALDDAETAARGYWLTSDPSFLQPYELVRGRIPGALDRLLRLTSDNPAQHQRMAQIKAQAEREMELLQHAVEAGRIHSASPEVERTFLEVDQMVMSNLRDSFREARLMEDQLLSIRDAAWRRDLTEAIIAAAILGLFNFVLLGYIYYVFTRDLTERRRAEAALRASEERLRLMIASVGDYAFFMLDPQGRVATWNSGAANIKGYQAGEIIGQRFSIFFPEENRNAKEPELVLNRAAKEGRVEYEGWRVRKDGSRFWANAISSAIRDERGHLIGFSEVTRDLTERKLSEEKIQQSQSRLAAILDGSPSVIFVKDTGGHYTLVNQRFETSFRLKREQVLGGTDMDIFPKDTAQKLRENDAKALEAGRALEFEELIPQPDGMHTYLSARVPLLGENNEPYALCAVSTDITERKKSEQEIQRLNRALQDRVVDRSVELMQATDALKIERAEREGAEEREREVRDRLREVMRSSPVPMWIYDFETMALLEVNSAASALHGTWRAELPQLRMTDLYPLEEVSQLTDDVESGGKDRPKIWRHRTRDGRVIPVGILARRIDWEGRKAVLVAVVSANENDRLRDIALALEAADSGS